MENWTSIQNDILDVLAKHKVITIESVNPNFAKILVQQFQLIRLIVLFIHRNAHL